MLNPHTGLTYACGESGIDIMGDLYPNRIGNSSLDLLEEEEVKLTPEQLAKIKQEIAEYNARKAEMERKKSKLQKFFERYIHFF